MRDYVPMIDKILDVIVPLVQPEKIILFGSYARGDYNENSDIDLLVLKKGLTNERETSTQIYHNLYHGDVDIVADVEVISMDYDKYFSLISKIGYIYKTIDKEGKVIYESL